ncbi:hypothetical protein Glove_276g6 [Diversispora epigaea]|uniref:Galactose oxidase n=1 Tax=Diversispora epigaea TaxID=1348612 RepID=A0A397I4R0_9GLOM|nr:hypothetical protein Glove_276g6 [Diversispora epigaea]
MYSLFKLFKFIFYIIFLINSISCYSPSERYYHNSVIIDDRLLIIAGLKFDTENSNTNELFYLDLSNPFDNINDTNLPWNLIHKGNLPINAWSSTSIVSVDNSTIFLIGGYIKNINANDFDFSHQVYTYSISNSNWTIPFINGVSVPVRQSTMGVINKSGIIYLFGGFNVINPKDSSGNLHNEMNTLDISSMTWSTLSITKNIPPLSSDYSACILPSGIIIYIGGQELSTLVNMKSIKLFDTNNDEWSYMTATGSVVDPRWNFASVLTPDGNIIIFGGCTFGYSRVMPNLALLNTSKYPYEWSIPSNSNVNSTPPSIYGHTANLYYNYMIITFGFDIDNKIYNNKVYLYNIKDNKWVSSFNPNPTSSSSHNFIKPLLIGLGAGICNGHK